MRLTINFLKLIHEYLLIIIWHWFTTTKIKKNVRLDLVNFIKQRVKFSYQDEVTCKERRN